MLDNPSYNYRDLIDFSTRVLVKAGLVREQATVVAETLVDADLMGHTTHGLHLLQHYIRELENGGMTTSGSPGILNDCGPVTTWDGRYLPGPWLVHKAIDQALENIKEHPVACVAIQKCHHIGCLATYPERATKKGLMMLLTCSDPGNKTVAPFGGLRPVYSPNPIAAGIPTKTDPIIFDISMSTTSNGLIARTHEEGQRLKHPWMMDAQGNPTDNPSEFFKEPPATILPLGGMDSGYKGFALGILSEALTSALGGYGRADNPDNWGCSVFLQIIDPDAFGGKEQFLMEMQHLADTCRKTETRAGDPPVRLPGNRALLLRETQKRDGLVLYPAILPVLRDLSLQYQVEMPAG